MELPVTAFALATRSPVALMLATPPAILVIGGIWGLVLVRLGMVAGWVPVLSGVFWIIVLVAGFWWVQRRRAARPDRGGPVLLLGPDSIDRWAAGAVRRTLPWSRVRAWSLRPFGFGRSVPAGRQRWVLALRAGPRARWPRLVIEATPTAVETLRATLRRSAPGAGDAEPASGG